MLSLGVASERPPVGATAPGWRSLGPLILLGAVSAAVYAYLTAKMSLLEFFPGPGITVDFDIMLGPDWKATSALLLTSFAALFVFYGDALIRLRTPQPGAARVIFAFAVVFVLVLTFMYPPQAVDFIHNVSDARTLWVFGDNAMTVPPGEHYFPVIQSYTHQPAPYGPLWFLLLFPVRLGFDNIQAELHILKLYTSLYYLGSAVLVYLIAKRLTPGRETLALALYAWHPFIVLRIAGNGHNDVTMIFFVLLATWLAVTGRWRFVLPALAASALVKYVTVILIPILLVAGLLRARDYRAFLKEMAIGGALSAVLVLASFAFFWQGLDTFATIREQAKSFHTSMPQLLRDQLQRPGEDDPWAAVVARLAGMSVFAVAYMALAVAYWRSRRRNLELIAWMALALFAYIFFAVTWYRPWYMLWPMTLLPLLPGRWPVAFFIVATMAAMPFELIEYYRTEVDFLLEHFNLSNTSPVTVAFVPPALVLVAGWVRTRRPLLVVRRRVRTSPGAESASQPPGR